MWRDDLGCTKLLVSVWSLIKVLVEEEWRTEESFVGTDVVSDFNFDEERTVVCSSKVREYLLYFDDTEIWTLITSILGVSNILGLSQLDIESRDGYNCCCE